MVWTALPHDRNNAVWNNGNIGFACLAVSRVRDRTSLNAYSGPARRKPDGEDLTVKGEKFQSWISTVVFVLLYACVYIRAVGYYVINGCFARLISSGEKLLNIKTVK